MSSVVLWRRLTETDFNAMHGEASPHGRGGGALHVALGVRTQAFPSDDFLNARRRTTVTIATAAPDFRRKLLSAYDAQCAVTRCKTTWVLEAAHITPYRGTKTNVVSNGILLRADIHTLFDLALISIDPARMKIRVSSRVTDALYVALDGTTPALPSRESVRPSMAAIVEHYSLFQP